jgi:hypothetical protein
MKIQTETDVYNAYRCAVKNYIAGRKAYDIRDFVKAKEHFVIVTTIFKSILKNGFLLDKDNPAYIFVYNTIDEAEGLVMMCENNLNAKEL